MSIREVYSSVKWEVNTVMKLLLLILHIYINEASAQKIIGGKGTFPIPEKSIDYIKPIDDQPHLLNNAQLEKFKKEHPGDKFIDMSQNMIFQNIKKTGLIDEGT